MKTNSFICMVSAVLLAATMPALAQTQGTMTFRVDTTTYNGNYAPSHVLAIWVTDSNGAFVKTLTRNAATRLQYLYQWKANSQSNVVDAITGATLNSHGTTNVSWNCLTTNGAVAPDGVYRIYIEFTEANAQGPFTNVTSFTKGANAVTVTPVNVSYFSNMQLVYSPTVVTNPPAMPSNFTAVATSSSQINLSWKDTSANEAGFRIQWGLTATGTVNAINLAANVSNYVHTGLNPFTTYYYMIRSTNLYGTLGYTPVISATTPPAFATETNLVIPRGSVWRYTDTNTDLSATIWAQTRYFDGLWKSGAALFGYGETDIVTTVSYGPNISDKYITCYFRRNFVLDTNLVSLTARVRRDDGVVLYLNGQEVARDLMPAGPIVFSTMATNFDALESNYYVYALTVGHAVIGVNTLAAEVHQVTNTSSDLTFDLELEAVTPLFTRVHDLAVKRLSSPGSVQAGDLAEFNLVVSNKGNVAENFLVGLQDMNTQTVIASNTVSALLPRTERDIYLPWRTYGVAPGTRSVRAFTVLNGVTDLVDVASVTVTVSTVAIQATPVGAAGSIGGRIAALAVQNNRLYVGAGARLEVWDATTPQSPALLGAVRLPGLIEQLTVTGTWVFASCGSAGLQVVDAASATAPVLTNTVNTSGHVYGSVLNGTTLWLADGRAGVRALNVATPATPVSAGAFVTAGPARAMAVSGTRAYVADEYSGLLILDVTTPATPSLLGSLPGAPAGLAVLVNGSTVWLSDDAGDLHAVDVTTPAAPVQLGRLRLGASARALLLNGSALYAAADAGGLLTVNASAPASPVLSSTSVLSGPATAVVRTGTTLYAGAAFGGLQVLDGATALTPVALSVVAGGTRVADVAVSNRVAYVAAGENGLRVYSITNASAPRLIGSITSFNSAHSVALDGTVACVGDGTNGIRFVNVANPAAPALTGFWPAGTNVACVRALAAGSGRVVASDGPHLVLLSITNPAAPSLVASTTLAEPVSDLVVAGNYVYAACGGSGLKIFSLQTLALVGACDTPGIASGVDVHKSWAYVADGSAGWDVIDVSNPAAPVLSATHVAQGTVRTIRALSYLVLPGDGGRSLQALDATQPLTPVGQKSFNMLSRALRIRGGDRYAITAEDDAGAAFFDVAPAGDTDIDAMPDTWEQQIVDFNPGDAITTTPDVDPAADFDSDGLSNYGEYLAGTQPTNVASVFAIESAAGANSNASFVVRWYSVAGKNYTLHKSTNLLSGFTVVQSGLPATAPLNVYTTAVTPSKTFYMITVP